VAAARGLIVGLAGVALLAAWATRVASGASAGVILIILVASLSWALGTIASTRLALPSARHLRRPCRCSPAA